MLNPCLLSSFITDCLKLYLSLFFPLFCFQYVFKAEAHGFRTVHEELAKGMTFDLKSNEHSAVRNVLKVILFILCSNYKVFDTQMYIFFSQIMNHPLLLLLLGYSSPGSSLS